MENSKVSQRNLDMVQHIIDSVYEPYEYDDKGRVGMNIALPRKIRKQLKKMNKKAKRQMRKSE